MMFIGTAPNFSTQADLPHLPPGSIPVSLLLLPYSYLLPNPTDPAQVLHQVPQLRSFLPALQMISWLLLGPSYPSLNSKALLPHCIQPDLPHNLGLHQKSHPIHYPSPLGPPDFVTSNL